MRRHPAWVRIAACAEYLIGDKKVDSICADWGVSKWVLAKWITAAGFKLRRPDFKLRRPRP